MDLSIRLQCHQKWVKEELERSIRFWLENGMDPVHGGVYTCLDREGKVFSTDKSVWMQGRCAWMFAYLCHVYGVKDEWLEASKSCLDFMEKYCINREAGNRMYFTVTGDGKPLRQRRYCFSEGFYAIANAEYYGVTGDKECLARARAAYDLIWNLNQGLITDPTGLGPKTIPETRSGRALANPMIYLNITSVLRRVDPEQEALYNERAAECVNEIFQYHYKPELGCTLESVAMDGTPRLDVTEGRVVNPGHDIECSWFLMEDANRKGDKKQHETAVKIFDQAINAGWDYEYGGLLYFIDCLGRPPEAYEHDMKLWWPHDEILIASLMIGALLRPRVRRLVRLSPPGRQAHHARLQGQHLQGPLPPAADADHVRSDAGSAPGQAIRGALMPFGNVFEKINSEYYQLTSAEKKVADYVVIHQQKTQFMSISELAEESGVAEATISRFCRRLDYKGYNAFKLAVANSTAGRPDTLPTQGEVLPEDSIEEMGRKVYAADRDAMAQTLELIRPEAIRRAADILFSAEKVLCMGQGGSMLLAQECAHLFSTSMPNFTAVVDSHMQAIAASHLTPRDAVLYYSYSGSTEELLKNLKIVRERKAMAILITRFPKSPGAAYADVVLQCGSREGPLQVGSVAARVAQLYLTDVLFHEVCRRDAARCAATREIVAEVLSDKHI